jgi:hypothetical protein
VTVLRDAFREILFSVFITPSYGREQYRRRIFRALLHGELERFRHVYAAISGNRLVGTANALFTRLADVFTTDEVTALLAAATQR